MKDEKFSEKKVFLSLVYFLYYIDYTVIIWEAPNPAATPRDPSLTFNQEDFAPKPGPQYFESSNPSPKPRLGVFLLTYFCSD